MCVLVIGNRVFEKKTWAKGIIRTEDCGREEEEEEVDETVIRLVDDHDLEETDEGWWKSRSRV